MFISWSLVQRSLVSTCTCVLRGLLWGWITGREFPGDRWVPGQQPLFCEFLVLCSPKASGERL